MTSVPVHTASAPTRGGIGARGRSSHRSSMSSATTASFWRDRARPTAPPTRTTNASAAVPARAARRRRARPPTRAAMRSARSGDGASSASAPATRDPRSACSVMATLLQQLAQTGGRPGGGGLDGAEGDAQLGGDLGLREPFVEAQRHHGALALGERAQSPQDNVTFGNASGDVVRPAPVAVASLPRPSLYGQTAEAT